MINRKLLRTLTFAVALVSVTTVAVLADSSHTLQVRNPATLNGVQLAAGRYKVSWETHNPEVAGQYNASLGSNNPEVTVTITNKDKEVIATAQGRLVDRDANYNRDAVLYRTNPDGSLSITELRFEKMKQVIVFDE